MRQSNVVTGDNVADALRDALPGIALTGTAQRIPKGFSSESWLVPTDRGEMLVKIRRQAIDFAKLTSQAEAARMAIGAGVPTPEILYAGLSPLIARPLVVARYLPGDDAETALPKLDVAQRRAFFADLGAAIGRLHQIALPQFTERIGMEEGATDDWAVVASNTADRYAAWNDRLRTLDAAETATIRARLAHDGGVVAPMVHPRLTHRDLYLANILIDDGRFVALLDFELAKGKDPLLDFVKLGMLVFEDWPDGIESFLSAYRRVVGLVPLALERLILCHGLEHLTMLPNWQQLGEERLADYSRRQLGDWLAGRYPAWLTRCANVLAV